MITGGDANLYGPQQFGFIFQFKAEAFFVRLMRLLAVFVLIVRVNLHI